MTSAAVELSYAYPFASAVESAAGRKRLRLATSGGAIEHPHFFEGVLADPAESAALLLAVGQVARSRFYIPPGMLERILLAADPVVTAGGERLRFEAFSQCCGVYARGDLPPEAIEGDFVGRGSTNVDFNPPMRAALAQIKDDERVGLNVGVNALELERAAGSVVERKVRLPLRWLKGFVEVQTFALDLRPVHEVPGPEARRFLASIPAQVKARDRAHVVSNGHQLRVSQRATEGSVAVGGIGRLQFLKPLARRAKALRIYGAEGSGVSGWEVDLGRGSIQVLLSPEAGRGFSGEGQALHDLASREAGMGVARVRAALSWQAKIAPRDLAAQAGLDDETVRAALAVLGSRGLVGYDPREQVYFHRELPFDMDSVETLHPRLKNARAIVEANAVRIVADAEESVEAFVRGTGVEHRVVLRSEDYRCTCPWFNKHRGAAGPCKHVLAVQLILERRGGEPDTRALGDEPS